MKKIFAFLLILVTLFGLAACTDKETDANSDKETDANSNINYIYDDAGRVIKEERYVLNDYTGEYNLSKTFEYAYDENGNLKEKRLYDESTTERISQTHKYDYNSAGQRLREEIYNHEQELVCTIAYTYGDDVKILSKEILHIKMKTSRKSTTVDGEKVEYYCYGPGYEYEADGGQYFGNYLFTDEVLDESATYRILINYYSNGVEKTRSEFRGDTLLVYKEYAEVGELEKQILSAVPGVIVGIYNEEGEEYLCEVGGNRYYKPCEDGTLETLVNALVDIYTYYPDGTVKSKVSYDKDQNYVQKEYYESGALMLHAEGKDYDPAAWGGWITTRSEEYYENGTLKSREECKYSTEEVFGVDYSLKEEFYESGAKKSVKEYDAEKGIDNYTQWDEEGNVIPAEE